MALKITFYCRLQRLPSAEPDEAWPLHSDETLIPFDAAFAFLQWMVPKMERM